MKRRIVLGLGAALLVGGWGTCGYAKQHDQAGFTVPARRPLNPNTTHWDRDYAATYRYGIAAMAIGAGLIGFAVLRPTTRD